MVCTQPTRGTASSEASRGNRMSRSFFMVGRTLSSTSLVLIASTVFSILNGGRGAFAEVWCQSPNKKLLKHTLEGNFTQPDQRVLYHQPGAIAIAFGIVEI